MTGIGNGLFIGFQSFNDHIGSYTGRQFPSSWTELQANVSNNIRTCAKACTVFLDSSVGLACAMGVFGIAATSVCAGQDVMEVVIDTLSANVSQTQKNDGNMVVCMKMGDHLLSQKINTWTGWTTNNFVPCLNKRSNDSMDGLQCLRKSQYQKEFSCASLPSCSISDSTTHDEYIFMSWNGSFWLLNEIIKCTTESTLLLGKSSNSAISSKDITNLKKQSMCQDAPEGTKPGHLGDGEQGLSDRLDVLCWDKASDIANLTNIAKKYLVNTTTCEDAIEPSNCNLGLNACSKMMIVFGVGSAVVLTATVGKIIYKQYTSQRFSNLRSTSVKSKQLLTLALQDGLLLGASGLGTGVLLSSIADPFSPVSDSTKRVASASTALYFTSAAARILMTGITSSVGQIPVDEEGVDTDLGELDAMEAPHQANQ
ncbi:hypothetical protein CLAVI_001027 [Candidatus Clavichlamydia salmonicola]|uniref:hypothetical protein n=1 Tax=Candidatus Clavichlamydia salmonicola TaxID=469812 RepID=UPI0018919EFF|nr:hypothetical protein [Candidatus Clavichlamydia salmonicola]MBF5051383.1 hypothetical protein [Candidatus Clavichlamydia salmonicola]